MCQSRVIGKGADDVLEGVLVDERVSELGVSQLC